MFLGFILLLNSIFSNNLRIGNDFYQLPSYSENTYKEIYALNVDNSFDINFDRLLFKTYLQIYEPIGFDSLNEDSNGLRKNVLQATQFQFDIRMNFLDLSLGRILNFEEYNFYSIDGFRVKFNFRHFSFSLLHGREINNNSFLGLIDFYDEVDRKILDYDISSLTLSTFYSHDNSLSLKYLQYKNGQDLAYQSLRGSLDINLWKIKSTSTINYLLTRNDFEQILLNFEIYDIGIEYEEYKPFFMNDSIFNIFVIEKYRRSSAYYSNKFLNVGVFTENFDYFGVKANINLFKYYHLNSEYLHNEHFYLSLGSRFKNLEFFLNYYHKDDFDSIATRASYVHKLIEKSNIKLYSDLIYNNSYKLQLRAGFLFNSYF
jgi:hypothetical protein